MALLIQRAAEAHGSVATLDSTLFTQPLDVIARVICDNHERHGEIPVLETLTSLVAEQATKLKPAQADSLRNEFAVLATLTITDPETTIGRAPV